MRNLLVGLVTVLVLSGVVVLAPGTLPPQVRDLVGLGPSPLGQAPEVDGTGSHEFLALQRGSTGDPVTYDPCRPIPVVVNTDGAPDEEAALEMTLSAMDRVGAATGLELVYEGSSDQRPEWRSTSRPLLGRSEPVLVTFADADEVSELEGRVAGIGGSVSVRRGGVRVYVTGQVTIDVDALEDLRGRRGGEQLAEAIILHEFGHLVGLAHVEDRQELMHAKNTGQLDFGPGDRTGLSRLGQGPCL